MLAKLLSLLIHAKAGAISGVLLLGATGALVSVSAQNGVTTITFTDPSPTPTATATPTPSPAASPKLSSPSTSSACSDEAKANALQVQLVDTKFSTLHTALVKLKGQRDEKVLETADHTLKSVRKAAVRAIHATATAACLKTDDDEDKNDGDEDKDEDKNDETDVDNNDQHGDDNDVDEDKDEDNDTTAGLTFTGDATSIANQAIEAMQTAFNTAQNAATVTSRPSHSPEQKKHDDKKHDDHADRGSEHDD